MMVPTHAPSPAISRKRAKDELSRRMLLHGAGAAVAAPGIAWAGTQRPQLRRGINAWPWFGLTREYPAPRTRLRLAAVRAGPPGATPPVDLADARAPPASTSCASPFDAGAAAGLFTAPALPTPCFDGLEACRSRAAHRPPASPTIVNLAVNTATHITTPTRACSAASTTPGFAAYRALAGRLAGRGSRDADPDAHAVRARQRAARRPCADGALAGDAGRG